MATMTLTGGCLGDERMMVRCDLARAEARVEVAYDGKTWMDTQYQCADARHTNAGLFEVAMHLAADSVGLPLEDADECDVTMGA